MPEVFLCSVNEEACMWLKFSAKRGQYVIYKACSMLSKFSVFQADLHDATNY